MTTRVRSLRHNKTTTRGIAACQAAGVEFWSIAPGQHSYWGVQDGQYHRVTYDPKRWEVTCHQVDHRGVPVEGPYRTISVHIDV